MRASRKWFLPLATRWLCPLSLHPGSSSCPSSCRSSARWRAGWAPRSSTSTAPDGTVSVVSGIRSGARLPSVPKFRFAATATFQGEVRAGYLARRLGYFSNCNLLDGVPIKPGEAFSLTRARLGAQQIKRLYAERGYLEASAELEMRTSSITPLASSGS